MSASAKVALVFRDLWRAIHHYYREKRIPSEHALEKSRGVCGTQPAGGSLREEHTHTNTHTLGVRCVVRNSIKALVSAANRARRTARKNITELTQRICGRSIGGRGTETPARPDLRCRAIRLETEHSTHARTTWIYLDVRCPRRRAALRLQQQLHVAVEQVQRREGLQQSVQQLMKLMRCWCRRRCTTCFVRWYRISLLNEQRTVSAAET